MPALLIPVIFKIKNKTNWVVTLIFGVGLLMTSLIILIILIIIPLMSMQAEGIFIIFNYILSVIPFAGFFILFLYFWLWNTFGKTVLTIEPEQITIRYKNKLFTAPKVFLKKEIDLVQTKDFTIEKSKWRVRYNFSLSGSTYSVVFIQKDREIRILDWITETKAEEIVNEIKKTWY